MSRTHNYIRELLWDTFGRSRGGMTRLKMITAIRIRPLNANQLANELGINYRAISHHVEVLERSNLIRREGQKFGAKILVSNLMEVHMEFLEEILRHIQGRRDIQIGQNYSRRDPDRSK